MDSLYLLIPLSIVLVGLVTVLFLWAVRSGQFDDLEGPAHDIFDDNDNDVDKKTPDKTAPTDLKS